MVETVYLDKATCPAGTPFNLYGGSSDGVAQPCTVQAGNNANGAGANLILGAGNSTAGNGGNLTIRSGTGTISAGYVRIIGLKQFADDPAAAAGGIPVNGLYHTSGVVKIRVV